MGIDVKTHCEDCGVECGANLEGTINTVLSFATTTLTFCFQSVR